MKAMQAEFRDRFVMAGAVALLVSAFFAALMLLPSYLVLATSEPSDNGALQQAKEDQQGINDLARARALLTEVSAVISATSSPSKAIAQAAALRLHGITLNRFAYQISQTPAQATTMSVSGAGSSRDVINKYRDALSRSGKFPMVSIPVNAIVGASEGGGFTATLTTMY